MLISFDDIIKKYNLRIKGVLHIGAHYGQEYADYAKNNIKNMIFFEPLEKNFNRMLLNVPLNENVKAYKIALGDMTGQAEMFVETANNGVSCSLLEPKLHLIQYPKIKFHSKEIVKVDKLDNIDFDRNNYNMINIDVQGYELEVFKGGKDTLNHIDIIYTEVNRDEVYVNCARVEQLDDFLSDYGFKRVLTSWDGDTWGDALYLK